MTRPSQLPIALACLAATAVLASCARVSLEPGSAAARPVTFQISIELPDAPPDGTATWATTLPPTIGWSTQGTPTPVSVTISHDLPVTSVYRWYLNGAPLEDATPDGTLAVGGAASDTGTLAIGHYILTGVVAEGVAIATVDWVFEVTE